MIRTMTSTQHYESVRHPLKRRCVSLLRHLVDSTPQLGDVATFLKSDSRAQDAVYTLHAMSFSPEKIAEFVARERFSEQDVLLVLSRAASRQVAIILKGIQL